jgi:hypothetical protein
MYLDIPEQSAPGQMPLPEEIAHAYMSAHLIPTGQSMFNNQMVIPRNKASIPVSARQSVDHSQRQQPNPNQFDFFSQGGSEQVDKILASLEDHLSQQLKNHELFLDDIKSIEEERNFYYRKLRLIEDQCNMSAECES